MRKRNKKEVKFTFVKNLFPKKVKDFNLTFTESINKPLLNHLNSWIEIYKDTKARDFNFIETIPNGKHGFVKTIEVRNNCYISFSHYKDKSNGNRIGYNLTFAYRKGNVLCELEPKHGPITIITKCEESLKLDPYHGENVKPHHIFGWCTGFGNWNQGAVGSSGIKEALLKADYDEVFGILKAYLDKYTSDGNFSIVNNFINALEES
jgi:hypothetical protein